jgi:hypothetical protein
VLNIILLISNSLAKALPFRQEHLNLRRLRKLLEVEWLFFFFFLWHWTLNSGLHFESFQEHSFVMAFFEIGSCKLFAWWWLWTVILPIAVYWVARISGVSHWHPAQIGIFWLNIFWHWSLYFIQAELPGC